MLDIETIVYSRVKAILTSKLRSKYSDISFTTNDKITGNAKFPNVYVHSVGSLETGNDFDNSSINGVLETLQIETTDNESQTIAKDVMNEVVKVMKGMRFTVIAMPETQHSNNIYRCVARFRRTIGNDDTL